MHVTTSSCATTSYIWVTWNHNDTATTNCCYTLDASVVWTLWAGNNTTASGVVTSSGVVTYSDSAWTAWNHGQTATVRLVANQAVDPAVVERLAKARVLRAEADKRAERLLLQFLTEHQQKQYQREQSFEVLSKDRKRRYRLRRGWAGNVTVIDDATGRAVESLCIHPNCQVPHEDNLLAQKLLLEADEENFRRTANITRLVA